MFTDILINLRAHACTRTCSRRNQIDTINDAIVNYRSVNNESDRIGKLFEAL